MGLPSPPDSRCKFPTFSFIPLPPVPKLEIPDLSLPDFSIDITLNCPLDDKKAGVP